VALSEAPADRYVCRVCIAEGKEGARGCLSPVEKKIWAIPYCPYCGGKKSDCFACEGGNEIPMHRCPRAEDGSNAVSLLPFFYVYRESRGLAWPDGRGRLFQTIKLVAAFDMLTYHFNLHEKNNRVS